MSGWITFQSAKLARVDQFSVGVDKQGELLSDQDKLVTLRQREWVCLANPRASYGYLYLDIYRQAGAKQ